MKRCQTIFAGPTRSSSIFHATSRSGASAVKTIRRSEKIRQQQVGEKRAARLALDPSSAYHNGMQTLGWTLVFTAASLEHLAEREIDADDVADAVFGRHGLARIRRGGRGRGTRWFVVAPLAHGEFLTCVLRAAEPRDLDEEGVFVVPPMSEAGARPVFDASMRLCVSARVSAPDEVRSYRAWRQSKGVRR